MYKNMNDKISIGDKDVLFLLGAGCSFDATVPISGGMITKLENLLQKEYPNVHKLYLYIKHTMEYGNKLFEIDQDFNIESLMVVLHCLENYKKNQFYPFILGYTNDLREYAGSDFANIKSLIKIIEEQLPNWVTLDSYSTADYYENFEKFQREVTYPIRIFSLNYDLCLEKNTKCKVETGFAPDKPWDGNRFTQSEDDEETAIYLYKLHGSINWHRQTDGTLIESSRQNIDHDIIFGTNMKMQAIDPYLFYLYEFRRYALSSRIIIAVGYSFNDNHINDLIRQALNNDHTRKLLIVEPVKPDDEQNELKRIKKRLQIVDDNVVLLENMGAKEFLNKKLSLEYIGSKLPIEQLPF